MSAATATAPVTDEKSAAAASTNAAAASKYTDKKSIEINALMIGRGEYTTGFVPAKGGAAPSDKGSGVVAVVLFDMRRRGLIGPRIGLCGTTSNGTDQYRAHMKRQIADRYGLDTACEFYPPPAPAAGTEQTVATSTAAPPAAAASSADTKVVAAGASAGAVTPVVPIPPCLNAIRKFSAGDLVTIFTPDDTHFSIGMAAISHGCHVLIAKPAVKTLAHHIAMAEHAKKNGVLAAMEVHKRYDPMYADARNKIRSPDLIGSDFNYFVSYMSQPKHQLDTFKSWAGVNGNDISYYLNAHHVDFHVWCMSGKAIPLTVSAMASTGVASCRPGVSAACEDTITLTVQWKNLPPVVKATAGATSTPAVATSCSLGTAVYTASWVAPKSDVHSQQRFFYLGSKGEVTIDQAHRGYTVAGDDTGFAAVNPLFLSYTPDAATGQFAGQRSYGYLSFEIFVGAIRAIRSGERTVESYNSHGEMATLATTQLVTAILESGRRSLDAGGATIEIVYDSNNQPIDLRPYVRK